MGLEWEQVVVAARDPAALGRWWSEALQWVVVNDDAVEFEIQPERDRLPGILFLAVDERKHEKTASTSICAPTIKASRSSD